MKRLLFIVFLVTVWTCSMNVRADCVQPRPSVALPDGATASRDQIVEAMKSLKAYDSAVTVYVDCLSSEATFQIAAAGGADVAQEKVTEIRAVEARRRDAAIDELQRHVDKFNEQVRVFKARANQK